MVLCGSSSAFIFLFFFSSAFFYDRLWEFFSLFRKYLFSQRAVTWLSENFKVDLYWCFLLRRWSFIYRSSRIQILLLFLTNCVALASYLTFQSFVRWVVWRLLLMPARFLVLGLARGGDSLSGSSHHYLCQESTQTLSNKGEVSKSLKFVLVLVFPRKDDGWLGVCY